MSEEDGSYKVGFGKPPKHSQFKPGQSGNRKGRPRKTDSLRAIMRKLGEETATVTTEKGETKITSNEWVLRALRQRAMKGDNRATTIYLQLWIDAYGLGPHDSEMRIVLSEEDRQILHDALAQMNANDENDSK